jgi:hypothetical protein
MASSVLDDGAYYRDRRDAAPFAGMKIVSFMKKVS